LAYRVQFEGDLIRQEDDSTDPSSQTIAQPSSVGKLLLPRLDASRSINATREKSMVLMPLEPECG